MADSSHPPTVLWALIALTVVSGLVDAVSYLGLGHVFTANMTGNIVILGFAAAGAPGFSVLASLTSLGCFLAGAVCAGRLCLYVTERRRALLIAMVVEGVFATAAAVVAGVAGAVGSGWPRYTLIAVLAFAMGVRNSTIRRLAVPDVTTTVLTMTLTGLAADSTLAGGTNPKMGRRTASVVAMLVGAFVGAGLFLHQDAAWPLAVVAVVVLGDALWFGLARSSHQLDRTA